MVLVLTRDRRVDLHVAHVGAFPCAMPQVWLTSEANRVCVFDLGCSNRSN